MMSENISSIEAQNKIKKIEISEKIPSKENDSYNFDQEENGSQTGLNSSIQRELEIQIMMTFHKFLINVRR